MLWWLWPVVSLPGPLLTHAITVNGNSHVSTRDVLSWMTSRPGILYSPTSVRQDLRTIVDRYRVKGFLNAVATLSDSTLVADSSAVDFRVDIAEGTPTVVSSVRLQDPEGAPAAAVGRLTAETGEPMDQRLLETDLDELLHQYELAGYPFARCAVDSLRLRTGGDVDSVDIVVTIERGPHLTIDEVRLRGNRETRQGVILRETRLIPGEVFDPTRVAAIKRRLLRLNIFSAVDDPQLYLRDGHGGLLIQVTEGHSNTFDGLLGYVPSGSAGQSGYLTGLASIAMRNLFGTGRKLQLRWQREDRSSGEISVRYLEPWVFGQPLNVGGGFFQRQQDTSYVHRILDGRIELMVSDDLTAAVSLRSERVIPSTDSTYVSPVPASSIFALGGDLLYDTRSDPVSPESGGKYRVEYSFGRKRVSASALAGTSEGVFAIQRMMVDLEFYVMTFSRQVAALLVHGYDVRGGNVGESDMFRFGGAGTLRGYRENQFLAARVVWSNAEYRFLLARRSFFFVFFDGGYYVRPADPVVNQPSSEALKYGYGFGIRVDTAVGNIGVSFALGQGDTFSTAKIHIMVLNDF